MSSNTVTLKYLLLAQDQASKVLKSTGKSVDETGKKLGGMSTGAKVALAGLGVAAVGFANSSINKFKQVTSESRGLQRALGGTLEEASRMREAAILSGVDYGTFQKSVNKLDKALVSSADGGKKQAAMVQLLGQNFIDATGHVEPMNKLLPQLSDKFAKMSDGPEKTALAMQLFGKAGTQMLPFLSKGSAGIADLEKQSDKFGTTLSGSAIDALAKNKEETRKWSAAMDGLKVQVGAQLLPIMNALVGFIQEHVIPIFQAITGFIKQHKDAVMLAVTVIGTLIAAIKIWNIYQAILNSELLANPIGLVVVAIAALAAGFIYAYKHSETFRRIVHDTFTVIKTIAMAVWDYYLKPIFKAWLAYYKLIGATAMWLWNNAIKPAWNGIRDVISGAWAVIKTVASAIGDAWHGIGAGLRTAWGVISNIFGWIKAGIRGLRDVVKTVVHAVSEAFKGIGAGLQWTWNHTLGPILNSFLSVVNEIIDALRTLHLLGPALGNIVGKPAKAPPGSLLNPGPSSGGRGPKHFAHGGNVYAGMPYVVGDGGRPELFTPDSNGHISPSVGGGGTVINNYYDITVQGSMLSSEDAVVAAINRAGNRGQRINEHVIRKGR